MSIVNTTQTSVPAHIGIIMDGNGRWAKKRGLPRQTGHKFGAEAFKNTVEYCYKIGVKYLTVYAFSTENWKRPAEEIAAIMSLLSQYIDDVFKAYSEGKTKNYKFCFIGDKLRLSDDVREKMISLEQLTKNNDGIYVNIAINYGGRQEILNAALQLAEKISAGELASADIDEDMFSKLLYTAGQPDPDIIIRPSGEYRISNFLLWQSAYSEFVYMDVLWPDFKAKHIDMAIEQYSKRTRRYGGI